MARSKKPTEEWQQRIDEARREAYERADSEPRLKRSERKRRRQSLRASGLEARARTRERIESSRRDPSETMIRVRGMIAETRRVLTPAGRAAGGLAGGTLSRIAHPITGLLLFMVRVPVALLAILVDLSSELSGSVARSAAAIAARVRPAGTVAFVCVGAVAGLIVSQFTDFAGLAVGADLYEGEVGTVAPAPLTDLQSAGSAHAYVLLGVAAAALVFTYLTLKGRWRFGRLVALSGAVTIGVTLLIDLPKGLDAGAEANAYFGAQAELLDGFWAQLACGAVLLAMGPLLGLYSRQASEQPSPRKSPSRGAKKRKAEVPGDSEEAREARRSARAKARSGTGGMAEASA